MMDLLDTTAFSAAMRHEPEAIAYLKARSPGSVAVAPPVIAEIEYGLNRLAPDSKARVLLEQQKDRLLGQLRLLDWGLPASERFGAVKAELERRGELIDDLDIAIAAIALAHETRVITANLVHFRRIGELASHHWTEA
jgi:tRNA(fMet)-specific endonuclease VapC